MNQNESIFRRQKVHVVNHVEIGNYSESKRQTIELNCLLEQGWIISSPPVVISGLKGETREVIYILENNKPPIGNEDNSK